MRGIVDAMGLPPSRDVKAALRGVLGDPDAGIREAAAQALGMQHDVASADRIARLLARTRPADAFGIAWALAELSRIGGRDVTELAVDALGVFRKRARGRSRKHAELLLERLTGPSQT